MRGKVASSVEYAWVQMAVDYSRNDNDAHFTHISLSGDLYGSAFTYDWNGNVLAVKDITNQ